MVIKVFLYGLPRAHTSLPLQYFLSLHYSSAYTYMLTVTTGNGPLLHLGRPPPGFSWQGSAPVTGLAPAAGLFKYAFSVTEIPATCNPHISAMPLCSPVLGTRMHRVALPIWAGWQALAAHCGSETAEGGRLKTQNILSPACP